MITPSQAVIKAIILVACSIMMTACSSSKDTIIPNDGVPIEDVYYGNVEPQTDGKAPSETKSGVGKQEWVVKRHATAKELDKNPYVLHSTLTPAFKRLENPTLYIFSFPYLTDNGRVPVPAYISEMKMFEREEYALPGEVNLNMGGSHVK